MSPLPRVPRCGTIQHALERLPAREGLILRRRYVDWWTYKEIGEELGLSVERTRQLVIRAERRLAWAICHHELDFRGKLRRRRAPPLPEGLREFATEERPAEFEAVTRWGTKRRPGFVYSQPSAEPEPRRPPPYSRRYESTNPPPSHAPLGTLEDVLEILDRLPLGYKAGVLEEVVDRIERLRTSETTRKSDPSDAGEGTMQEPND